MRFNLQIENNIKLIICKIKRITIKISRIKLNITNKINLTHMNAIYSADHSQVENAVNISVHSSNHKTVNQHKQAVSIEVTLAIIKSTQIISTVHT